MAHRLSDDEEVEIYRTNQHGKVWPPLHHIRMQFTTLRLLRLVDDRGRNVRSILLDDDDDTEVYELEETSEKERKANLAAVRDEDHWTRRTATP
jgi:hypothetical protein